MPDLLIKEDELNQLDRLIGDGLTYRQAAPIVQFFQLISQKRAAEAAAEAIPTPKSAELTAIPGGKAPDGDTAA